MKNLKGNIMSLKLIRNDITKLQVDVIVNTANDSPIYATGVDYAIYKAAGEEVLLTARKEIGYMKEGQVAIQVKITGYKQKKWTLSKK